MSEINVDNTVKEAVKFLDKIRKLQEILDEYGCGNSRECALLALREERIRIKDALFKCVDKASSFQEANAILDVCDSIYSTK